jgi:hypothetical protein
MTMQLEFLPSKGGFTRAHVLVPVGRTYDMSGIHIADFLLY